MSLKGIRWPVTHIFLGICGAIIYKVQEVQCSSPGILDLIYRFFMNV